MTPRMIWVIYGDGGIHNIFEKFFLTFLSTLHVAWPRLRSWSQSSFANCARRISSLTEKRCDRTGWQDKEDGTEKKIKPTNLSYFSGRHFFPDCQIFRHQDGATPLPTIILHDHHRRPSVRPSVRRFPFPLEACQNLVRSLFIFQWTKMSLCP